MLLSLEWLSEYIDLDLSDPALPGRLAHDLLMNGLEAEVIERSGKNLDRLLVAEVLSAKKHPNADKLKLCRVHDGEGERQIVCGAPNVAAGQKVVLAPPGITLPGGMEIKPARIRGEESEGMLCSERELEIGDDHSGIIVLDPSLGAGGSAGPVLGLDDVILEISVTPNRGDCLSLIGVAREVSAILGQPLKLPPVEVEEALGESADALCGVEILDTDKCPRYVARVIQGVRIGPSPAWMQQRLRAAGMRPISNVVDVTNYVMLSLGQPLHAFDIATLAGRKIVVRRWKKDDGPFTTLDGLERRMSEADLMICDAERPVAIGGVMGGQNSEINNDTEDILLESAYFAPSTIRATRRSLNISTEASYRFERGIDPEGTRRAADWAVELIRQTGGGQIAGGAVDVYPTPAAPITVRLRTERASELLGIKVGPSDVRQGLEALGMAVKEVDGSALDVDVPLFRHDIEREIDLIEELARRIGYEKIPSRLPATSVPPERPPVLNRFEKEIRESMISAGYCEALNYSFVSQLALEKLGNAGDDMIPLQNPISIEMNVMRTTLLAGLIGNAEMNLNRGVEELRIFEIGRTYHRRAGEKLPTEVRRVAALISDSSPEALWPDGKSPGGEAEIPGRLFDLKGALERVRLQLRVPEFEFSPLLDEGSPYNLLSSAIVLSGSARVGVIGSLGKNTLDSWGIGQSLYVFELDLEVFAAVKPLPRRLQAVPRFPASLRDLAIVVGEDVSHGSVSEHLKASGGDLLNSATLFDIYQDAALLAAGKKSLAYSFVFRDPERTLNDAEVDKLFWDIVKDLENHFGARIRG
jgi:phenylalanyl-tRNA synthetase beta chain